MKNVLIALVMVAFVVPAVLAEEPAPAPQPPVEKAKYVVTPRIVQLPLWRLNEALKKTPLEFAEVESDGRHFLHAVADPDKAREFHVRITAYGDERAYPRLIVNAGEEGGTVPAAVKKVPSGADPTLDPKRGIVFKSTIQEVPVQGIALKATCVDSPAGISAKLDLSLTDRIQAAGPGGDKTAPMVVIRNVALNETVPDGGSAVIVPPVSWQNLTSEVDPVVQVVMIEVKKATPQDLVAK